MTSSSDESSDEDEVEEAGACLYRVLHLKISELCHVDLDLFCSRTDEAEHNWGEIDKDAPEAEEVTSRLALCNMDWDRISAQDILVILNSFKPPGSVIKTVTVGYAPFPSPIHTSNVSLPHLSCAC